MSFSKLRKIMYTPVNPSFTVLKWGLRGSKLYRRVFAMYVYQLAFNYVTINHEGGGGGGRLCVCVGGGGGGGYSISTLHLNTMYSKQSDTLIHCLS